MCVIRVTNILVPYYTAHMVTMMYGSERWLFMGDMLTVLEVFHHQVARQIAVNTAWSAGYGGW